MLYAMHVFVLYAVGIDKNYWFLNRQPMAALSRFAASPRFPDQALRSRGGKLQDPEGACLGIFVGILGDLIVGSLWENGCGIER